MNNLQSVGTIVKLRKLLVALQHLFHIYLKCVDSNFSNAFWISAVQLNYNRCPRHLV